MERTRFAVLAGTVWLAGSALVHAHDAYTSRPTNVHAGPDPSYPLVAQLAPGSPVDVAGCLSDWSWCDVGFDDTHGWVYAPSLIYDYEGSRVPLYSYAPSLGLPIITFSLGSYWDRYYRGRPWFGRRDEWEHRRVPHRRPPGPAPRAQPPPHTDPGFRPHPGGGPRPEFRPRGDSSAPERGGPDRAVPERGPRTFENGGRANIGREITPRREMPQRGAAPGRGEQRGEQGRGGEHAQSGHGDNRRDEDRGRPPR